MDDRQIEAISNLVAEKIFLPFQKRSRMAEALKEVMADKKIAFVRKDDRRLHYSYTRDIAGAVGRAVRDRAAYMAEGRDGIPNALSAAISEISISEAISQVEK